MNTKNLTLEQARKRGEIDRFSKENPSSGVEDEFDELLEKMAGGEPPKSSPEDDQT
jgi:hypothetical protein